MSGDFSVQLATHLPDWGGFSAAARFFPCVVSFSRVHEHDTHDLFRDKVASILVTSSSDSSDTPDFLVTC